MVINLNSRLRLAFYPFVFILFGIILGCSLANWIIFIQPEKVNSNPDWLHIYIPLAVSMLAVWICLRPIINQLSVLDGHIKTKIVYYLAPVILITTSNYYSQILLEDLSAKVVHLNNIADIYRHNNVKFYTLEHHQVKQVAFGHYLSSKRERWHGHVGLIMDMFFVFPASSNLWMGMHFHQTTGTDYKSWEELEPLRKSFVQDTLHKVFNMPVESFYYLERISDNFMQNGFDEALKAYSLNRGSHYAVCGINRPSFELPNQQIVLLAHYEPLKNRIMTDLYHLIAAFIAAFTIWMIIISPPINDRRS